MLWISAVVLVRHEGEIQMNALELMQRLDGIDDKSNKEVRIDPPGHTIHGVYDRGDYIELHH